MRVQVLDWILISMERTRLSSMFICALIAVASPYLAISYHQRIKTVKINDHPHFLPYWHRGRLLELKLSHRAVRDNYILTPMGTSIPS
jgi:hypothetical protein